MRAKLIESDLERKPNDIHGGLSNREFHSPQHQANVILYGKEKAFSFNQAGEYDLCPQGDGVRTGIVSWTAAFR